MPFIPKEKLEFFVPCELNESQLTYRFHNILDHLRKNATFKESKMRMVFETTISCEIEVILGANVTNFRMEKVDQKPRVLVVLTARLEFLQLHFDSLDLEAVLRPLLEEALAAQEVHAPA